MFLLDEKNANLKMLETRDLESSEKKISKTLLCICAHCQKIKKQQIESERLWLIQHRQFDH